jgi:hypothetical protein
MIELITISVIAIAFIVSVGLWVSGIDSMKDNHPEYKGKDLFNEQEKDEQN